MTKRRTRRFLGDTLEADSTAQRIYGREIVTVGTLLDISREWTSRSLSTAVSICAGYAEPDQLDKFARRLKRSVPAKGPFDSFLSKDRGLTIDPDQVDWPIVAWATAGPAHKLMALGLLTRSLGLDAGGMADWYESLIAATAGARPLPLRWQPATDLADSARSHRLSLHNLRSSSARSLSAWDVMGELALVASVSSDKPTTRARAAFGTLASGIQHAEPEGVAAVLLLILSRSSIDFDLLPFGSLRHIEGPAGPLIGWIADLYMTVQIGRMVTSPVTPALAHDLTESWPHTSYAGLPLAVAIANGQLDSITKEDVHTDDLEALSHNDQTINAWFEGLPETIVNASVSEFTDGLNELSVACRRD